MLQVIWKQLYRTSSGMDAGTMYQLRNLINRRNVVKTPKDSVAACEDFFLLLTEAHILAAAMTNFGMESLDDTPSSLLFPEVSKHLSSVEHQNVLMVRSQNLFDTLVDMTFLKEAASNNPTTGTRQTRPDDVYASAYGVLTNGLFLMKFIDGIREGDGSRIVRCWRYLMMMFKACQRKNYAIETSPC